MPNHRLRFWAAVLVGLGAIVLLAGATWIWFSPIYRAESLLKSGHASESLQIANELLRRRPDWTDAISIKARSLAALERWPEAALEFDRFHVASAKDVSAWSVVLLKERRWEEALPLVRQRSMARPGDGSALQDLVVCLIELRELDEALGYARELSRTKDFAPVGYWYCGQIFRRRGRNYEAIKEWRKLVEINPDAEGLPLSPGEFFLELSDVLVFEGKPRTALPYIDKSLSGKTNLRGQLLLADARRQIGDATQASDAWKKVLEQESSNIEARMGLADIALEQGQARQAIEWLQPVAKTPNTSSTVSFLMFRAATMIEDRNEIGFWRQRTSVLRDLEKLETAVRRITSSSLRVYWTTFSQCYRLTLVGGWEEAKSLMEALLRFGPNPFLEALNESIKSRSEPPPLRDLTFP